jgi:hypothetical protein
MPEYYFPILNNYHCYDPNLPVSVLQTMHVSGWTRLLHDKYYDSKQEVEYLLIILI